jgi:glycosyltransferase involved in cell wall biosynthesis
VSETLIVDWLGRGGIAQTAAEWQAAIPESIVVTRSGRELDGAGIDGVAVPGGGVRAHLALTRAVAARILDRKPAVVVIHNFLVPAIDRRVHRAARRVGARVVFVVHDHRLHSRLAGTGAGLRPLLRTADVLVAHSEHVRSALAASTGRSVRALPLPLFRSIVAAAGRAESVVGHGEGALLAVHFGVVKRGYKGAAVIQSLGRSGVDGWTFAVAGVGATASPGVRGVDRFLDPAELAATVRGADALLLPYTFATQSGAVSLAQAFGRVAVASAVGGIPEQIDDGTTGVLVDAGAPPAAWAEVLAGLRDGDRRARIGAAAAQAAVERDERFRVLVREVVR